MRRFTLILPAGLLVVALGCRGTRAQTCGVVKEPSLAAAPEIAFTRDGDKQWRLSQLYGDVAIVAFVTAEGENCARISPAILAAAKARKGAGIPIVEVVHPTGDCRAAGLKVAFHEGALLYTLLEDPEGGGRAAFGLGREDKAFLIAGDGRILKEAAPSNVAALFDAAEKIAHAKTFSYPDTLAF